MISTEVFLEPQILLSKIHYIRNHPCLVVKGELCSINYAAYTKNKTIYALKDRTD